MDEIKSQRAEKDATAARRKIAADEIQRNKRFIESFEAIANMSWSKYFAGAVVVVTLSLLMNLPLVRHIHFKSRLGDEKQQLIDKFMGRMDKEDSIFQQNLLKRFRSVKKMDVKNVTDDELRTSKFFD